MTILTKPFSEKKGDRLVVPLVTNEQEPSSAPQISDDIESQQRIPRRVIIFSAKAQRVTASTTFCLFIIALAVVCVGIVGGKLLYDEYLSVTKRIPSSKFEGWVQIPLGNDDNDSFDINMDNDMLQKLLNWNDDHMKEIFKDDEHMSESKNTLNNVFFQENFEIDEEKDYEKIDVPDFRNGRNGRFIHDFNTNTTGIIDVTGQRCFVMPLNRDIVLPPKSLFDLVHKMWDGYYKVDTSVIKDSMKVITPPLKDYKDLGMYISTECNGMPIYKLEKYSGGITKRSAELHSDAKFAQFAGKRIYELDIINLDEAINFEQQQKEQK